jgi:hypothetical protein
MALGPVQLLVLGCNHPNFPGEIIEELERLRASDTARVIDWPWTWSTHPDCPGGFIPTG